MGELFMFDIGIDVGGTFTDLVVVHDVAAPRTGTTERYVWAKSLSQT